MKYGNTYYIQLSRVIFNEEPYKSLSNNAKWLYVVLKELEQRYTGENENFFYRSNEELSEDMGVSIATFKRAKAELIQTDLIETWRTHFVYNRGTLKEKLSEKQITCYRLLK